MSESYITKRVAPLYSCYRGVFKGKCIPHVREVFKSVSRAALGSRVDVSGPANSEATNWSVVFATVFGDQEMLLAMKFGSRQSLKPFGL